MEVVDWTTALSNVDAGPYSCLDVEIGFLDSVSHIEARSQIASNSSYIMSRHRVSALIFGTYRRASTQFHACSYSLGTLSP